MKLIDKNIKITHDVFLDEQLNMQSLTNINVPSKIFSIDVSKNIIDHARNQQSLFIRKCKNNAIINIDYINGNVHEHKYLKYKHKYLKLVKDML